MKLPIEFRQSTLEFINSLMTGLGYNCIFNIMIETGNVPDENIASLEREISNHFYVVKDVLKNDSSLKKIFGYLLDDVLAKYYDYGINCLVRTANSFEKKHNEAKTKGHIGTQISYLEEALVLLKNMDKDSFAEKKNLQKKFEPLKKKIEEVKLMNSQVYQARVPPRQELTDIKPIEQKIRPLEPKNIRIPPNDSESFSGFKSEEMEGVKSSLTLFVSNKKQHIEKTMFDLKERITEVNKAYNVSFLKNLVSTGSSSQEAEKKLKLIREQGQKSYIDQSSKVSNLRHQLDENFHKIDKIVEIETEKDKATLNMVQGGGYITFVQSFSDQLKTINDLKQNYRGYRGIEERIFIELERFSPILLKITNTNETVHELLSSGEVSKFVQENLEKLTQLKKYADGLDILIGQHLGGDLNNLLSSLNGINIEKYASKVLMNETNLEVIYKEINEQIGGLVLQFEEKISKVLVPMDKIKALAQELSSANPNIFRNSTANDTLVAIDFFHVISH